MFSIELNIKGLQNGSFPPSSFTYYKLLLSTATDTNPSIAAPPFSQGKKLFGARVEVGGIIKKGGKKMVPEDLAAHLLKSTVEYVKNK